MSAPTKEQGQGSAGAVETTEGDFSALLKQRFRPANEEKGQAIEDAVSVLCEHALAHRELVAQDTLRTIHSLIAALDERISTQLNEVIHHEEFQKLEGAWRGLHHLVTHTETDESLQIRVLPISKDELRTTLRKFPGTSWDQSPLFKQIYEHEYGQLGGTPYSCLIGDYQFDHTPPDVEALTAMGKIAAAAHAPFISAAGASVLGMDSYQELSNPRDISAIFTTPEYAGWRALRDSEDSRYIGLTMPRFLARQPYGAKSDPVEEFGFEEDTAGGDPSKFCWANSAYAMATNIGRAFKLYGWCARIRGVTSGGLVENLPTYTFPTDEGGVAMTCPTEIAISDRREAELASSGFMPLVHRKHSNQAAFIGAQSLQRPAEYDDPDATANAALSARLPYMFATCRFAHYLKAIVRDRIGSFDSRSSIEKWLSRWIGQYVHGAPEHASDIEKAKRPLAAAQVVVEELEDSPGYYGAQIFLQPHYQLEGLTVALKLISRLPSEKG